jgi:hypothetical protein
MKNLSKFGFIGMALLYPALFYKAGAGVNVLIYNAILIALGIFLQPSLVKNKYYLALSAGSIILGFASFYHASHYTLWINGLLLFLLSGVINYPYAKSLFFHGLKSLQNIWGVFDTRKTENIVEEKPTASFKNTKSSIWQKIKSLYIYFIPALIIFLFIRLYSGANQIFEKIVDTLWSKISFIFDWIADFFPQFNFTWAFNFLLGLYIAKFLFHGIRRDKTLDNEVNLSLDTQRKRKKLFKFPGLKLLQENKAGIFLFATLNVLLLFLNIIDIQHVWLNFSFNGETLKEFVHEGTYNLIISIILGAGIVLYFFRGNLNFLRQNTWLRRLSVLWILQNIALTFSVLMRTVHYINHYNLAYKRIGLIFFCLLIIWGLIIVAQKVQKARSIYFLNTRMAVATMVVLFASAPWDWASIITRFNLSHAGQGYVHYNFLQTLPDRCLPLLQQNMDKAFQIESKQRGYFNQDISPNNMDDYKKEVSTRIKGFKSRFAKASWKEWTMAEQRAFDALSSDNI